MKVVALVSGGKDSCFNMMQCQRFGHEIVALANLLPAEAGVDELDSFMFQTVGHQLVAAYAECTGLPLFRRHIQGSSRNTDMRYAPTAEDEVEDLAVLLEHVKRAMPGVEAVSSGAIASDYQRLRVESVCSRLGLVSLAYLWKQPQDQLLQDMIDSGIHAVLVKVAALGLKPEVHLGKSLQQMQGTLRGLGKKFGVNVCGEGGEYETLTLDCPLFTQGRIVLDTWHIVEVSADPGGAPVAHMSVGAFHVERKGSPGAKPASADPQPANALSATDGGRSEKSVDQGTSGTSSESSTVVLSQYSSTKTIMVEDPLTPASGAPSGHPGQPGNEATNSTETSTRKRPQPEVEVCSRPSGNGLMLLRCRGPTSAPCSTEQAGTPLVRQPPSTASRNGWSAPGECGTPGIHQELSPADQTGEAVREMLEAVRGVLGAQGLTWNSAVYIRLYLVDMAHFGCANRAYSAGIPEAECPLGVPSRATVEMPAVIATDRSTPHSDVDGVASAGGAGGRRSIAGAMLDVFVAREVSGGGSAAEGVLRDSQGTPGGPSGRVDSGASRLSKRWHEGEAVKSVLHVKSISSWAPSCIGPYSQCTRYRNLLFMAGQLGLDPSTMELIKPSPHSNVRPSEHTSGTPTPAGVPAGTPGRMPAGVPQAPGASSVAVAEARRALASCQAVSEALGGSCGAHSLSTHVYCSPEVGEAERQGVLAELRAFFGLQGKSIGVSPDPQEMEVCNGRTGVHSDREGVSGRRLCEGGDEEEEEGEVDELRGLRGSFQGMWSTESSGEATGRAAYSIAPTMVFLSVPALPKGAAVEIAPVVYAPANPSPSDHPGEVPEPLTVAQSGAVLCSGHVIAGQLCSAHLFAPLEQHQDTRPSKHLHVVQTGQDGDALVVPGGEEMASVGDLTTCQEQGGVSEAGVASALAVKLCEALQVSGLAWDDVAELRVHYDQQSMQGEALEAALKKHLVKLCDSKFTVRPVCIPVLDIHIANREGGFAPVSAHAQMLALGVAW